MNLCCLVCMCGVGRIVISWIWCCGLMSLLSCLILVLCLCFRSVSVVCVWLLCGFIVLIMW